MIDEGYIKFECDWEQKQPFEDAEVATLNIWRKRLYNLGLIGVYPNGIGYGNVSQRLQDNQFVISGTQTGNFSVLEAKHYAKVDFCDVNNNYLRCIGLTKASSESMSHFAIYQQLKKTTCVFHIHHYAMWKTLLHKVPTTGASVAYGTPEMVYEIQRLFRETTVLEERIFVTAGHEEGIFTFGDSLEEAGEVLLRYFEKFGLMFTFD